MCLMNLNGCVQLGTTKASTRKKDHFKGTSIQHKAGASGKIIKCPHHVRFLKQTLADLYNVPADNEEINEHKKAKGNEHCNVSK